MSLFDKARNAAEDFAAKNPDKVSEGIERVGEQVDQRTGGRYTEQIDQAERTVADRMGTQDPESQPNPEQVDPGQQA